LVYLIIPSLTQRQNNNLTPELGKIAHAINDLEKNIAMKLKQGLSIIKQNNVSKI